MRDYAVGVPSQARSAPFRLFSRTRRSVMGAKARSLALPERSESRRRDRWRNSPHCLVRRLRGVVGLSDSASGSASRKDYDAGYSTQEEENSPIVEGEIPREPRLRRHMTRSSKS